MSKEKTVNYSDEQIAVIVAAAPLDLAKAKSVAEEIGKTYRSVISKAKQLGLEYKVAAPAKKRVGGTTKAAMVAKLEGKTSQKLEGLEKAPAVALANLIAFFDAQEAAEEAGE